MTRKQRLIILNVTLAAASISFFIGQWMMSPRTVLSPEELFAEKAVSADSFWSGFTFGDSTCWGWFRQAGGDSMPQVIPGSYDCECKYLDTLDVRSIDSCWDSAAVPERWRRRAKPNGG